MPSNNYKQQAVQTSSRIKNLLNDIILFKNGAIKLYIGSFDGAFYTAQYSTTFVVTYEIMMGRNIFFYFTNISLDNFLPCMQAVAER